MKEKLDKNTYIRIVRFTLQSMLELSKNDENYNLTLDTMFYYDTAIKKEGVLTSEEFFGLVKEIFEKDLEEIQEEKQKKEREKKILEEKEYEEDMIELTLHFEIKNSTMYGGKDSIGYAMISVEVRTSNLKDIDVVKYAQDRRESVAKMCEVDVSNVRIISKSEYEEATKEEEE